MSDYEDYEEKEVLWDTDDDRGSRYSDEFSSDLENELYSAIYHAPGMNVSLSTESNRSNTIEDVASNGVCSQLVHDQTMSTYDLKSISSLLLECTKSTPKCSSKEGSSLIESVCEQEFSSVVNENDNSAITPNGCDSDSDCSIYCIDSWDSNDFVTNIEKTKEVDKSSISRSAKGDSSDCSSVVMVDDNGPKNSANYIPITIDSSSSDDEDDMFSKSLPIMLNSSMSNENQNLWHLDPEDKVQASRRSKRYFKSHTRCSMCRGFGHPERFCPKRKLKKCFLCGGDHVSYHCRNKVCGSCFKSGHLQQNCCQDIVNNHCTLCKLSGHMKDRCPDKWRRYHLTTSPDGIVKSNAKVKKSAPKYCYNCGAKGHYGYLCKKPRPSRSLPASPYVISYKEGNKNIPPDMEEFVNIRKKSGSFRNNIRAIDQLNASDLNSSIKITPKNKRKKKKVNHSLSFEEPHFERTPLNNDQPEFSHSEPIAAKKLKNRRRLMRRKFKHKLQQNLFKVKGKKKTVHIH